MQVTSKFRCTNCFYEYDYFLWEPDLGIEPMTDFEDIEPFNCPICSGPKDDFAPIKLHVNEIEDIDNIFFEEEIHTPFYEVADNKLIISVWRDEAFHPMDEEHYIKYVWLFDEDWDLIALKNHMQIEDTSKIEFSLDEIGDLDYFEIRVWCNAHWDWCRKIQN